MTFFYRMLLTLMVVFSGLNLKAEETNRVVVARDGSGNYTTIGEAINACKAFRTEQQVIYIKNGIYHEKILIDSFVTHLKLTGENADSTVITWGDYAGMPGIGTFNSYTMKIMADDVILENLTVENSAGEVGQAVAIHVEGDRCLFINCRILGHQDTLYSAGAKSRHYFLNCYIDGTTDFIFGAATAIFEKCTLHSKRNSYITAASTPKGNSFGYVFKNCRLTAAEGIDKVYLGRPWRDYAQVVFLNCEMGQHIAPEGWHNWSKPEREKTAYYGEYQSFGPGAQPNARVSWSHQLSDQESEQYTFEEVYQQSDCWIPEPNN